MPPTEEQLQGWRRRREERLGRLAWLRSTDRSNTRTWYVADEMLILDEERQLAETVLSDAGHTAVDEQQVVPGVRRYRTRGMDVPATVRELTARSRRGPRKPGPARSVAGPNHVFLSSPFHHGGPFGPPEAASPADLGDFTGDESAPVAVIDTGVWRDSPLPECQYVADPVDFETATDVDGDGLLDGDVGHANFIAGVILAHTDQCRVRVIKVLDTHGLCTEAQLIAALARVPDDVKVVNLSLGGYSDGDMVPVGLQLGLKRLLHGKDRVAIAAAGNDGNHTNPFWPAAFAGSGDPWSGQIAAVVAHDGRRICDWSNTGAWVTLAAEGEDVTSTFITDPAFPTGWATWSGTSFATPRVVAAVLCDMAADGSATGALARVLKSAGAHVYDGYIGLP